MRTRQRRHFPAFLGAGVIGAVCLLQILSQHVPRFDLFRRLEWMSYDWRVRQAMNHPKSGDVSTNLAAVFIDDDSLRLINQAWGFSWPWPRQLHGRLARRLSEAGADAIAFDILFQERHPDTPATDVALASGASMGSDTFFATQLKQSGNVVLAAFGETMQGEWRAITPDAFFGSNAWRVAHAASIKDADGLLRRAKAYHDDRELGRIWHMGIVMAAHHLGLDLDQAEVWPDKVVLRSPDGLVRTIPTDEEGFLYINWVLTWNDPRLLKESFERAAGFLPYPDWEEEPSWAGRLVFVGSIGSGNNISDIGATPLARETYLVSNHWNVANSVLTGHFIKPPPWWLELGLVLGFGLMSCLVTWRLRAPWPSLLGVFAAAGYVVLCQELFLERRFWLPMVIPLLGGLGLTHVALVIYQVFFEQREKRHVKGVFARLVSPEVVNELLEAETLNLGGARRRITVLFTDVRGFTEMTDLKQQEATRFVEEHGLKGDEAESFYDIQARETLNTVNDYLAVIADEIKRHNGTLDKYIGDCVMAFWGAPTDNDQHAVWCVRAAMAAQRAIHERNKARALENARRREENKVRAVSGQPPLSLLPLLALGTGISTGQAIVGLMGSSNHIINYTVFGRDVNLASRLESVSGRGRIIISEQTFLDLCRYDPELAGGCVELEPVTVKGIRGSVKIYEVPWNSASDQVTPLSGKGPDAASGTAPSGQPQAA